MGWPLRLIPMVQEITAEKLAQGLTSIELEQRHWDVWAWTIGRIACAFLKDYCGWDFSFYPLDFIAFGKWYARVLTLEHYSEMPILVLLPKLVDAHCHEQETGQKLVCSIAPVLNVKDGGLLFRLVSPDERALRELVQRAREASRRRGNAEDGSGGINGVSYT